MRAGERILYDGQGAYIKSRYGFSRACFKVLYVRKYVQHATTNTCFSHSLHPLCVGRPLASQHQKYLNNSYLEALWCNKSKRANGGASGQASQALTES